MNPGQAVASVYRQYIGFSGRATRSEFWWFWLFYVVVILVLVAVRASTLAGLFALVSLVPSLAVAVRRLHDVGRTGWWLLLGIVPFGGLVLLVWYLFPSKESANQYGPPPGAGANAPIPSTASESPQ
jgi:uncharacterized membrane protein YhaH (DUF805 family)